MDQQSDNSSERSGQLNEIVAAYIEAQEREGPQDQQKWLSLYPQFAQDLAEYFDAQERVAKWGGEPSLASTESGVPPTTKYRGMHVDQEKAHPLVLQPADAPCETIRIGSLLASRYRVFDVKRGGMAVVLLAHDTAAERRQALKVAIKTVQDFDAWKTAKRQRGAPADRSHYDSLVARFNREAMTWVRLGWHNNIVLAFEVIELGRKPYLVMEHIDGGDLDSWIRSGKVTIPVAINLGIQFCKGMNHAFSAGQLVHRDIKPANTLVKTNGILKISDFGLARAFDEGQTALSGSHSASETDLSAFGAGTRPYMAPEQFQSLAAADTRSDIFSFGAMMFEMLTAERLFDGMTAYEMAICNATPRSSSAVNPDVPERLSDLVSQCVAFHPQERYQTFAEIERDLMDIATQIRDVPALPDDEYSFPAEFFAPTIRILTETYTLISLGRFQEAAEKAQAGTDVDPHNGEHWINRGKALGELGDYAGAQLCSERATELRPDDPIGWANLGWTLLAQEQPKEGFVAAERATQLDAAFADGWLCRGSCEREVGQQHSALKSLNRAVELAPHDWKTHVNLGFALSDSGQRAAALSALRASVNLNPDNDEAWRAIALILAEDGRTNEAHAAIDRCLQISDSDAEAWGIRALIEWQGKGDLDAAHFSLRKALQLEPLNERVRKLALAIAQSGY